MKKKTKSKKSRRTSLRRNTSSYYRIFFLITGLTLFFVLSFFLVAKKNTSFCANSISCINNLTGMYEPSAKEGVFMGKKVSPPLEIAYEDLNRQVLGDSTGLDKHIDVDLSTQTLYAYEGDKLVYKFLVSTGKWHYTPTGTFNIWVKLLATRMSGGDPSIGTYYNLPNVPYTMFYSGDGVSKADGYSIHGAYWHNNFGHPMSHGCINMKIEEAQQLYFWASPQANGRIVYASTDKPGTEVRVYGETPSE